MEKGMSISIYQASVPIFSHMLGSLSGVLAKAEANAEERKIDPAVFIAARLAPDMFPLKRQVQIASDFAKGASARLAGREVPSWGDSEETFADLQARIAKTRDFLESLKESEFEGGEARPIELKVGPHELKFDGLTYLQTFALPNFYFHVTTAYDILRHNGVPLSKIDFLNGGKG
jgi:hypothetical protein